MKCAIVLVVVAIFASSCDGQALNMFPLPQRRCCAEATQCYSKPWFNPPCKKHIRPSCKASWYKPCYQGLTLLRKVWARFSNGQYRCCRVYNCPKIYYSRCSFMTERCSWLHRACAPHFYRRHFLKLWCPGAGWRFTWRYLPRCCICHYCRPRYFPTLPAKIGKSFIGITNNKR